MKPLRIIDPRPAEKASRAKLILKTTAPDVTKPEDRLGSRPIEW